MATVEGRYALRWYGIAACFFVLQTAHAEPPAGPTIPTETPASSASPATPPTTSAAPPASTAPTPSPSSTAPAPLPSAAPNPFYSRQGSPFEEFGAPTSTASDDTQLSSGNRVVPAQPKRGDGLPPRFGERGQFAILFDPTVFLSSSSFTNSSASLFSVGFEPSIEYFVARNVSVGVELDLSYSNTQGYGADSSLVRTKRTLLGGGVHFGMNVPLGAAFSVYPMLAAGLHRIEQTETLVSGSSLSIAASPTGSPAYSVTGPWLEFLLPLLYHPAPHFFVGIAPTVYHDFSRAQGIAETGAERTGIGVGLLFGGYFDFREPPPPSVDETVATADAAPSGFGKAHTFFLTDEATLAYHSTAYAGTGASANSLTLAPGFDWFYQENMSVGFSVAYSHSSTVGEATDSVSAASTMSVHSSSDTFGFAVRFSSNVAIADWVSLYPRVSLGYSHAITSEVEGTASNDSTQNAITGSIGAPLLFHVAPHFVVGFGPELLSDLYHGYQGRSEQIQRTTIALDSLIGGWL
ncbi:MAG TPA: hypothetical protein VHC69_16835 [Polyangiaceae bacterium]|nr:hypothetical protein [Polyangiaceae bacterium]